ncbi:MAG: hypothetical protein IKJ42_02265 [Bacteroidaceae bacterium]|nr:hypothetical protein [Bacteroidaceae bacterium]
MKNNKRPLPASSVVLAGYLQSFIPATGAEGENLVLKTSQQIQDDLSTMVDITLNDIAEEMVSIGYKVKLDEDGLPKWMMSYGK